MTTGWSDLYFALFRCETDAGRAGAMTAATALGTAGEGAGDGSATASGMGSGAGGGGVGSRGMTGDSGSALMGSAAGQTSAADVLGGSSSHVGSLCVVGSSQPASGSGAVGRGCVGGATAGAAGAAAGAGAGFSCGLFERKDKPSVERSQTEGIPCNLSPGHFGRCGSFHRLGAGEAHRGNGGVGVGVAAPRGGRAHASPGRTRRGDPSGSAGCLEVGRRVPGRRVA